MNYTILKISQILDTIFIGKSENIVDFILIDSRMLIPSDNSIFFAIKTKSNDGHKYIKSLYIKGLRNFVVEKCYTEFLNYLDANFILVENSVKSLQVLASFHRSLFKIPIIGITGSNGKTIVKEWLNQILCNFKSVIQSPKSYNSQIGVPLSIWELNSSHEIGIFEAGISMPNEMENLQKIINPNIGLITNIGDAHQENFENLEQKINEKLLLFKNSDVIIYCSNDKLLDKIIKEQYTNKFFFTFSNNSNSNIFLKNILRLPNFNILEIIYKNTTYSIKVNFNDNASINNILAVISILVIVNSNSVPSDYDFLQIKSLEMRMQQIQGINNCTIINDSYNSDLASLRIALDVLNSQNQTIKKSIIISDFQELVSDKETLYKNISSILNNVKIDRIVGVGEMLKKYQDFFSSNCVFFNSTDELLNNIQALNFKDETILLKASRKYQFELVSQALQLKNHRTVFEINMSSFSHNLLYFKSFLKPETKIMAMVKAFSYGSGSFEIANFLQQEGVDYLAVANVDEGIELRNGGITIPILILNPDTSNFEVFDKYLLEPEIYSFRILDEFYNTIKNNVYNRYPIHLKINTGMNRLGFSFSELAFLVEKLKKYDKIFVKSVFTHLVGSGDNQFDDFTLKQVEEFEKSTKFISDNLRYNFIRHILNSSGIERFYKYQYEMVRLGIGLYGVSSIDNKKLKHIGTLKTQILQIFDVAENETIGYNRVGVAKIKSKIATIPIGYADGLNRKLSNGIGKVLINNTLVPIIGNICMDLTMIDITSINANEGDEVIIFNDVLTIDEIANQLGTIPYEILTSIPQRVKRVYIWE